MKVILNLIKVPLAAALDAEIDRVTDATTVEAFRAVLKQRLHRLLGVR